MKNYKAFCVLSLQLSPQLSPRGRSWGLSVCPMISEGNLFRDGSRRIWGCFFGQFVEANNRTLLGFNGHDVNC